MVQQDLRKFESQALKPPFNGRPGAAGPGLGEAARRGGSQTSVSQAAGSAGGLPVPVAGAAQTPRTVTQALRLPAAEWHRDWHSGCPDRGSLAAGAAG